MTWLTSDLSIGMEELRSLSLVRLEALLVSNLTDDLRKKPWKGNPNKLAGHCYVASEALHHIYPVLKPAFVRVSTVPHWYLIAPDNRFFRMDGGFHLNSRGLHVVDLTWRQFPAFPSYNDGVRKGFLTKEPSKRTRILLERMMLAAMVGAV